MENSLGVKTPHASQIVVMGSPVGPYYPTGFKPISLSCSINNIRSAPGGTGLYKVGGYLIFNLVTMAQHLNKGMKLCRQGIIKSYGFMEIK